MIPSGYIRGQQLEVIFKFFKITKTSFFLAEILAAREYFFEIDFQKWRLTLNKNDPRDEYGMAGSV